MKYYIKERHNPQTGVYYVACGQLSKTAAKKKENSLYGYNTMIPFDTEQEYLAKLADLKSRLYHVNDDIVSTAAAALGSRGGSRNTAAQNAARAANGKRGGRPRKTA